MRLALTLTLVIAALQVGLVAAEPSDAPPRTDSLERDYSEELPRIAPLEPKAAMKTFRLASGFELQQVAAEPLVMDPVAMAFDEHGRLYVVEMRGYSENDADLLGRVRLLTDQDGDGSFDASTVFLDNLPWPTAVACYDGGVFIGVAPDIIYAKDTDQDGEADQREVRFTGFHRSNVQGLLNSFTWGLDNRIHGATSGSGAAITVAGAADAEPLVLRGRDFAFDPRSGTIEATSGGGQHGLSFDVWGNKFVCSNSDHIQMVMFEDRYALRNPYVPPPPPRVSIAVDGPQADVFRISPVEPWRIVRTRLRSQGLVPGPVERGGKAAGYFTSATGVTIYSGNSWPEEMVGTAIVGDVGGNLVHRKRLVPDHLAYKAHRIDEGREFLASSDIWFRPVQFAGAPDGTLYIADMYREVIEHPQSLHPIIKQHLDLTSGRDRGRLYRIVPEQFQQPAPPRLGDCTAEELVQTLSHPNGWHRETAARLLVERQDQTAVAPLQQLVQSGDRPEGRIRSLYALEGLNALTPDVVLTALGDDHPRVREHAVKLAESLATDSASILERWLQMVHDPDEHVRYQLAFSLGQLPAQPRRNQALVDLALQNLSSEYLRFSVLSSLREGAGAVLVELAKRAEVRSSDEGLQWLKLLSAQIGKQQRHEDIAAVMDVLAYLANDHPQTLATIVEAVAARPESVLGQQLRLATGEDFQQAQAELLRKAEQVAQDESQELSQRLAAVHRLRLGSFARLRATFEQLLASHQPAELQQAALSVLATMEDANVAQLVLQRWSVLSPALRSQAVDVLASRIMWLHQLLAAAEQGQVSTADLQRARLQVLAQHEDEQVRRQANQLLDASTGGARSAVVAQFQGTLDLTGDVQRGQEIFKRVCSSCHQVAGVGHNLAPNIATMRNRGPEAILINILDPNREVNPDYINYLVTTTDGRTLSGMITAETGTSITLKRAEGLTDTVLRIEIDELHNTGLSLMPEGLEKDLDQQALADVISYLMTVE